MARILVTEEIADGGLERLRQAGHDVDIQVGKSVEELLTIIPGAAALIIRSATQVDAELLAVANNLMVVGRAGIGLDNVDVAAATKQGVMVVNAPQSNIVSAAEHTMALLLATARNVPQAHAALVAAAGPASSSSTRPSVSLVSAASASWWLTVPGRSACGSSPMTPSSRKTAQR
jgi:D-3-phosphoglycerate dehydrogenase / 2-oxoglutarate reductase